MTKSTVNQRIADLVAKLVTRETHKGSVNRVRHQATAQLSKLLIEAEYRGELTGMQNCWNHIRTHLNDNQGFVNWYGARKNAIETAYMPVTASKEEQEKKQ